MHFIPPLILRDCAFFQLPSNRSQHFTGIVGKVKVSHFSWGDGHNGKSLFVFFECRSSNLEKKQKTKQELVCETLVKALCPEPIIKTAKEHFFVEKKSYLHLIYNKFTAQQVQEEEGTNVI